jgi:ATP-dependent exoDNAse (exonuclease V) alpha subunit
MTTRELIYTAITRAKKTVYIAGDLESIRKAAANPSNRITMVGAHLDGA